MPTKFAVINLNLILENLESASACLAKIRSLGFGVLVASDRRESERPALTRTLSDHSIFLQLPEVFQGQWAALSPFFLENPNPTIPISSFQPAQQVLFIGYTHYYINWAIMQEYEFYVVATLEIAEKVAWVQSIKSRQAEAEVMQTCLKMFVEFAYGTQCGATVIELWGNNGIPIGRSKNPWLSLDRVQVRNGQGQILAPDYRLPFWQRQENLVALLAQPGEELYYDESNAEGFPVAVGQRYCQMADLQDLLHQLYRKLECGEILTVSLEEERTQ